MFLFLLNFLILSDSATAYYCDVSKSSIKLSNNNLLCNSSTINIQSSPAQVYVVGNTATNSVTVENSIASFYLLNTNIKAESAFSVKGGKVEIIVQKGQNTFTSSNDAGLSCSSNAEITISGQSDAKLTSISSSFAGIGSGKDTSTCKLISINGKMTIDAQGGYYGAGIGGGWGYTQGTSNVGEIIIQDGKVTATSPSNAGIGGGVGRTEYSSNVDSIKILGGIVASTGGEWGAGIGGGYGFSAHSSNVNTILISGGQVTSTGGRNGAGIGAGAGLSSTNASSVTKLSLIANAISSSSDSDSNTVCVNVQATGGLRAEGIGNGVNGRVANKEETAANSQCSNEKCTFGTSSSTTCFTPWRCDVSNCFNCPSSSSQCTVCAKGYTLVNSVCQLSGSTQAPQPPTQAPSSAPTQTTVGPSQPGTVYYCDVSKSSIKLNSNSLYCNSSDLSVQESPAQVYVVGNTASNGITVENAVASFFLMNTNVRAESAFSVRGGKVDVYVQKGQNTLASTSDAGLSCSNDAEVTIRGQPDAKLTSSSALYAGIGAGKDSTRCKLIAINGKMTVEAQGGYYGAGIGGGWGYSSGTSNVGSIVIQDGKVSASSPSNAGIGGGVGRSEYSSNVESIMILGGVVASTGGEWGAGIGGGYGFSAHSSNVNSILVSGGEVTCTGGRNGAGIGAGAGLSSTNASSVGQLTLKADAVSATADSDSSTVCVSVQATGGLRAEGIGNGANGRVANKEETGANSQCSNEKCTFSTSSSTTCFTPWRCDVSNCFSCPSSSSQCTVCEKGYTLVNSVCQLSGPTQAPPTQPPTQPPQPPTQAPSSAPTQPPQPPTQAPTTAPTSVPTSAPSSAPTVPPTHLPTTKPMLPITSETVAILFCPIDSDTFCIDAESNWASNRQSLISSLNSRKEFASVYDRPSYEKSLNLLEQSAQLQKVAAGINGLNSALSELRNALQNSQFTEIHLIILQRGSMQDTDHVDFTNLRTQSSVTFRVDYDVLTESNSVNLKCGDNRPYIAELNFFFADSIYLVGGFDGTLGVNSVSLHHSHFIVREGSSKYKVLANTINCDVYSSSSLANLADKTAINVFVEVPASVNKVNVQLRPHELVLGLPLSGAKALETATESELRATVNAEVATEQTAVNCTTDAIDLSLEEGTSEVDYWLRLIFNNLDGKPALNFVGDNWKDCKLANKLVVSSNDDVDVEVNDKPKSVKVEKTNAEGKAKKKKLSTGAIVGIVIAVAVVVALIIFLCVYFLVIKKKKKDEYTKYGDEQKLIDDDQF